MSAPHLHFSRTLAQAQAKEFLKRPLLNKAFHHAWLIHGAPGLGQEALALDIRDILACTDPVKKPCLVCSGCKARLQGTGGHISIFPFKESKYKGSREDLEAALLAQQAEIELRPYQVSFDDHDEILLHQIERMMEKLSLTSLPGAKRVVTLFYPEKLRIEAANKLLKILEEPPPDVFFLLASKNKSAVVTTIRSRCLPLFLVPLTQQELQSHFTSGTPHAWLPLAQGSPGRLFEMQENENQYSSEIFKEFFALVNKQDFIGVYDFAVSAGASEKKSWDWITFLKFALEYTRQDLHQIIAAGSSSETFSEEQKENFESLNKRQIYLDRVLLAIHQNAQPALALSGLLGWRQDHAW